MAKTKKTKKKTEEITFPADRKQWKREDAPVEIPAPVAPNPKELDRQRVHDSLRVKREIES